MFSKNPFGWIAVESRRSAMILLCTLTLVLIVCLQVIGNPLQNQEAKLGIISLELAASMDEARVIVSSWDPTQRIMAGISLGLDYLFMVAYAATIGLACRELGVRIQKRSPILQKVGFGLAWAVVAAACFDAVENYALIRILIGSQKAYLPQIAHWSARLKFWMVAFGLVYCFAAAILYAFSRRRAHN